MAFYSIHVWQRSKIQIIKPLIYCKLNSTTPYLIQLIAQSFHFDVGKFPLCCWSII